MIDDRWYKCVEWLQTAIDNGCETIDGKCVEWQQTDIITVDRR